MDPLDQEVNALFRQWDEARMRVHACKQLLQQCANPYAGSNADHIAAELRTLQAYSDTSLQGLLELMQRRRVAH
jgi:hypothetical protein